MIGYLLVSAQITDAGLNGFWFVGWLVGFLVKYDSNRRAAQRNQRISRDTPQRWSMRRSLALSPVTSSAHS
jgi:hypothetical protein